MRTLIKTIALSLGIVLALAPPRARADEIQMIDVNQAAERIVACQGRPVVILLYAARCPRSRRIFPKFVGQAENWIEQGASVLAFSTDQSIKKAAPLLEGPPLPFTKYVLQRWKKGDLSQAMAPLGIQIGKTFDLPLIAVIKPNGQPAGQKQGASNINIINTWLNTQD